MDLACSLYNHNREYHLSCSEALYAPIVSPFAIRHLELAESPHCTAMQRLGHRVIAVIEFIPVVGLLATLIERVVCAALKWLGAMPQTMNPIRPHAKAAPAPSLAVTNAAPIQTIAPTQAEIKAAEELIEFCKHIPGGSVKVQQWSHLDTIQQADRLRQWLAQDPTIASMTTLKLDTKGLKAIPPEIERFKNLIELEISYCWSLSSLPSEIGNLTNLQKLLLIYTGLTSLPSEIGNLINLQELQVIRNKLSSLPPEIGNLTNLQILNAYRNKLASLPLEIDKLTNLRQVNLRTNELTVLPKEIGKLTNLHKLLVSNNQISSLFSEIGNLASLRELDISRNRLTALPQEVGKLANLRKLYTDRNQLSTLPAEVSQLNRSCRIVVDSTVSLPITIQSLTNITNERTLEEKKLDFAISRE